MRAGGSVRRAGTVVTRIHAMRRPTVLSTPVRIAVRIAVRLLAVIVLLVPAAGARAEGWRNHGFDLFTDADGALQCVPYVHFESELVRHGLVPPGDEALPDADIAAAESEELHAALLAGGVAAREKRDTLVRQHLAARRAMLDGAEGNRWLAAEERMPVAAEFPDGIPAEFAEYLRGAVAWHGGDAAGAVAAWEELLRRPEAERRYKSVWAEFMLGRARLAEDPVRAIAHFQSARALAGKRFPDRLNLARASLGLEAKALLALDRPLDALRRYLEQARAGGADVLSIRWTLERLAREQSGFDVLAADPPLRRVFSALLADRHRRPEALAAWERALADVKVSDPVAAELLALAAYRNGDIADARRWLEQSPPAPVTQWLRAKLLLRDRRPAEAVALMERTGYAFAVRDPEELLFSESPPASVPASLVDSLGYWPAWGACEMFHAELATLHLAQGRFTAALERFLDIRYWGQAAYIAERVLTVGELKAFVDARWERFVGPLERAEPEPDFYAPRELAPLLARRLTREGRGHEAAPYLPAELRAVHGELVRHLRSAWDESQPAGIRAEAFTVAGRLVRTNGLELVGTELDPDFAAYGGDHEGTMIDERLGSAGRGRLIGPGAEERRRALSVPADPMQRWHYRYIASDLLWRAAELMADNTDAKAQVLDEAGRWLMYAHPQAADRYYKQLVRSCGETELGRAADRRRWFP